MMSFSIATRTLIARAAAFAGFTAAFYLASVSDVSAQCALCRDAVAAASPETREAMNYAIVGLAFAPYGVGAMAAFVVSPKLREYVKQRFQSLSRKKTGEPR